MTMMPLAGTAFAIFVILFLVGFAVIMAMSRKPRTAATGLQRVHGGEYVLYGATLINDGYEYYPDWCSSMLREFDDSIEPKLEQYYSVAKSVAKHPRDQWPIQIAQYLEADQLDGDRI